MADYCHDFLPGDLGCSTHPCPPDCVGDFTNSARSWAKKTKPGYEVQLGICEGHGALLFLVRKEDGSFVLEHADLRPVDGGLPTIKELTRSWSPQ